MMPMNATRPSPVDDLAVELKGREYGVTKATPNTPPPLA
jgi:hypothetical protein